MAAEEKPIDLELFEKLCNIHCTEAEIAGVFKVSTRTIERRISTPRKNPETGEPLLDAEGKPVPSDYKVIWDKGQSDGKIALRRLQWRHAKERGSHAVNMTIHLAKFLLGESEASLRRKAFNDDASIGKNAGVRVIKVVGGLNPPEDAEPLGEEHTKPLPNPFDDPELKK